MKLQARVNHGRWIVDCPKCGGAELARVGQSFACRSGYTGFNGESVMCGFEADIEFPADKDAIEAALIERPVKNRNWFPGETVIDLIRENQDHGIGVR